MRAMLKETARRLRNGEDLCMVNLTDVAVLLLEVPEDGIVENDEFLVDVHGLVLDAQIQVIRLAILD